MLLTSIVFNINKVLKHQPKKLPHLAIALPVLSPTGQLLCCWRSRYRRHNRLDNKKEREVEAR